MEKNSNSEESETKQDIFSDFCEVSGGPQETGGQPKWRNEIGSIDPGMGEKHILESQMHSIAFCSMRRA